MGTPALPSGSATPQGATVLAQKIGQLAEWTHYNFTIDPTHTGFQRIYFHWHNDNSAGTNPPAAIDNVTISKTPLQLAEFLQVTPYDTAASVIWSFNSNLQASSYTRNIIHRLSDDRNQPAGHKLPIGRFASQY